MIRAGVNIARSIKEPNMSAYHSKQFLWDYPEENEEY